jgi:predicted RNA binding protein YcfA (HicA-like mRNA interferase family)
VSGLPVVSGRALVNALAKVVYQLDRQRGSHMILRQAMPPFRRVPVPDHRQLAKGTLRADLRQTGLSTGEFVDLL